MSSITVVIMCLLIIAFQFSDTLTTHLAIQHGFKELNPILSKLMGKYGLVGLWVVKAAATVILCWLVSLSSMPLWGAIIIVVVSSAAVVWNMWQMIKNW